ncbi:hypothetical protein Tco_0240577 [Tanacetum coccineum]
MRTRTPAQHTLISMHLKEVQTDSEATLSFKTTVLNLEWTFDTKCRLSTSTNMDVRVLESIIVDHAESSMTSREIGGCVLSQGRCGIRRGDVRGGVNGGEVVRLLNGGGGSYEWDLMSGGGNDGEGGGKEEERGVRGMSVREGECEGFDNSGGSWERGMRVGGEEGGVGWRSVVEDHKIELMIRLVGYNSCKKYPVGRARKDIMEKHNDVLERICRKNKRNKRQIKVYKSTQVKKLQLQGNLKLPKP